MLAVAPAIRARRKARCSDGDEARALLSAMRTWRDTPVWVPVVWGGKILGIVKGDPWRGRTHYQPNSFGTDVPYSSYDDAVFKKSSGKHWMQYWEKPCSISVAPDSWYDLWGVGGNPQAGDWSGTALTARPFVGPMTGSIWTGGNVAPSLKYVTRASQLSTDHVVKSMILYDRVLSYDQCTFTAGTQTMTNTLPATRYVSTGDPGLQIFAEASNAHSSLNANLTTLTYVNQAGTGGQVVQSTPLPVKVSISAPGALIPAPNIFQIPGNVNSSGNPYLLLAQGDQGARSITNFTYSAAPSGLTSYVLQFPLALFPDSVAAGQTSDYEFVSGIENVGKRIRDDAVLSWLFCIRAGVASTFHGVLEFGWT